MTPELHSHCTESKLIKEIRIYIYICVCIYLKKPAAQGEYLNIFEREKKGQNILTV